MKDDELRQNLRKLRVPKASESARERTRHRSLIAFQQRASTASNSSGQVGFIWRWGGAAFLAVVLCGLSYVLLQHRPVPENLANDREILRQMEMLFPGQVDAVVQKNGKTDLAIAQAPVVGFDQPLVVIFQRGQESIRVLSYSGHRVCLDLGNSRTCFDILETPNGGVILEGENKVWLASQHPVVNGYAVRAQTLEASL
jgi:hypothetical protein